MGSWCQVTMKHEDQKLKSQVISCKLYAIKHVKLAPLGLPSSCERTILLQTSYACYKKKNDQQGN